MRTDREDLIEQAVGAFRERTADGRVEAAAAWRDLDAADRERAFDHTIVQRRLEAAIDGERLSTTARSVLGRIRAR